MNELISLGMMFTVLGLSQPAQEKAIHPQPGDRLPLRDWPRCSSCDQPLVDVTTLNDQARRLACLQPHQYADDPAVRRFDRLRQFALRQAAATTSARAPESQ